MPAKGNEEASANVRVLWKGVVVLHDGTQLPGISIVTTMHPWAHLRGTSAEEEKPDSRVSHAPLEAEAELCLALEMVRHHPLRALVTNDLDRLDSDMEASGYIVLQVDDTEDMTVAYMEQLFCLQHAPSPTLRLLFEPSSRPTMPFSAMSAHNSVLELLVSPRERVDGQLDLVVGRPVPRARAPSARPDDPAPRIPVHRPKIPIRDDETPAAVLSPPSLSDARVGKRGQLYVSLPDVHHTRRPPTPGRRGEKRPPRHPVDKILTKTDLSYTSYKPTPQPRMGSPTWKPVVPYTPMTADESSAPMEHNASLEQTNRTLIKKLVKYQLSGRGMERENQDHAACFQTAYAGTSLVFRHELGRCPLDKQKVAHVVQAHLDMYVDPTQLALCVRKIPTRIHEMAQQDSLQDSVSLGPFTHPPTS